MMKASQGGSALNIGIKPLPRHQKSSKIPQNKANTADTRELAASPLPDSVSLVSLGTSGDGSTLQSAN
jgi:hypothetical protein